MPLIKSTRFPLRPTAGKLASQVNWSSRRDDPEFFGETQSFLARRASRDCSGDRRRSGGRPRAPFSRPARGRPGLEQSEPPSHRRHRRDAGGRSKDRRPASVFAPDQPSRLRTRGGPQLPRDAPPPIGLRLDDFPAPARLFPAPPARHRASVAPGDRGDLARNGDRLLTIHARRALVGAALGIGVRQNVLAADLVVEGIEAIAGFCLRFRVQRRLQFLDAVRS